MSKHSRLSRCIGSVLLSASLAFSATARADEAQALEELRNTVINLLEGLVQKGVLTREQAQAMVQDAQDKSAAQAKVKADRAAEEKDAVRVTYVPEIVKQEISDQVRNDLRPEVTKEVIAQAKTEKWGVPGALPDWINKFAFYGDLRFRTQSDDYAPDNATNTYLDFNAVNSRGGIGKAGTAALLNTTEDRLRERVRLRLGANVAVTDGVAVGMRLATGNFIDPVSTNQTLGNTNARYTLAVDQAYLQFDAGSKSAVPWMTVWAGRLPNPWYSSNLVWDLDLQFDGVAATWRWNFDGSKAAPRNIYFTGGAFPLQEIELSTADKWLYAGQLGVDWTWSSGVRLRAGAAYYYFDNVTGMLNTPDSTLLDFTAPQFVQKGNTMFDIRNDTDTSTNLFALSAGYQLQDITVGVELPVFNHKLALSADYVQNTGFDQDQIFIRTGALVEKRNVGYLFGMEFGTKEARYRGNWRGAVEYRYVQRDAVVDAFTDSDFHLGGTDAQGYTLKGEWWFKDRTFVSLRYLSSNEIDGPPFGIDTVLLDFTGEF